VNQQEIQHWIEEVDLGFRVIEMARVRIGKALKKLRGDGNQRRAHFWRQDPDPTKPDDLKGFDDYCHWRWGLSANTINHYIRAAELVEDLEEKDAAGAASLETTEEFVLRPLTHLPKEERQRGWEIARDIAAKEEKKLSSRHTTRAAAIVRQRKEDEEAFERAHARQIVSTLDKMNRAELELVQAENLGIAQGRANAKVTDCLKRLFQDENEKACLYLARLLANRLFEIYPQLLDEPIRSFSLKPVGE
jgi:type I site-specific restriction endonuclease